MFLFLQHVLFISSVFKPQGLHRFPLYRSLQKQMNQKLNKGHKKLKKMFEKRQKIQGLKIQKKLMQQIRMLEQGHMEPNRHL